MHASILLAIQLIPDFIIGAAVVIIGHWVWLFGLKGNRQGLPSANSSKKGYQTGSHATQAESNDFITRPPISSFEIPGYGAVVNTTALTSPPISPSQESAIASEPTIVPRIVAQPDADLQDELTITAYQKAFEEAERIQREKEGGLTPTTESKAWHNPPIPKQAGSLAVCHPQTSKQAEWEELPLQQVLLSLQAGSLAPTAISQLERLAQSTLETDKALSYPMEPSQPLQLELADYLNAFPCLSN